MNGKGYNDKLQRITKARDTRPLYSLSTNVLNYGTLKSIKFAEVGSPERAFNFLPDLKQS